jgi:predicted MFS family arabinose efflux permease
MGLRPDGDPVPEDWETLPAGSREREFTLNQAIHTRAYWLIGVSMTCVMFAGGSINFHQIPHLIDQGLSRTDAALAVMIFSTMSIGGALIGGAVAMRITIRRTMAPSLLVMAGGVLLLLYVDSMASALVYALVYGSFFGVYVAMNQVVYAEYFGRRSFGTIRGSMQPVGLLANAGGPFAGGLWYDVTGSYTGIFILYSALFLVAALAMTFAPYPRDPATVEA